MDNSFYYNDDINKTPRVSSALVLAMLGIITMVLGYIFMTTGIFNKVEKIETTTERKIVYVGEEKTIKVKVKNNGEFNPAVKFKSEKDNFTLSEDIQYGEEVETKIIGSKVGSDTLVIEAGKDASKKEKVTKIEILVCDKPEITNTGDKIINIKEGNNLKLEFNVAEECLKGYEIEIENNNVASIDSNYNLTAKKVGTTDLVLKRNNDRIKYKVNVKALDIGIKSIIINAKSLNLEVGKVKKLSTSVLPSDATNRRVIYSSSDESIATVSSNGTVKGINVGVATITVTSASNPSKKATITAKVYKQEIQPPTINVTSVAFKSSSYTIEKDSTQSLEVVVSPSNATNKTISCASSNKSVATVTVSNNTCVVKGIKKGTVTITAISKDGSKKGTTSVTINEKPSTTVSVTGVSFESSSYKVYVGSTTNLVAKVVPSNATNKTISCASSNTSVATVTVSNNTCVAKGVKAGSSTITVITKDGSKTATANLTVENEPAVIVNVTSIKFDKSSYTIAYNETKKLPVGITPTNATNKTVTCKSLNTTIVTVSYSGNVCTIKGVKPGTTTIEAYSVDGNKKATTSVTVSAIAVKSVSFEKKNYTININDTKDLKVIYDPTNATNKVITCSSSNSALVTVSAKGEKCSIKGIKEGKVTITATTQDGNKTASTEVTIKNLSNTIEYTITYDLNGGSGVTPPNGKVKYNLAMPKINTDKPTRAGYKFMGWYDNTKYTSGKKYNNVDGTSANKYDKTTDTTLYAGWEPNKLYVQYNGNGGEWHATKDKFSVNQYGTVVLNDGTNTVFNETINYGSKLSDTGLVDCNAGYMNWIKTGYKVETKKEYFVENANKKTELDQAKAYSAVELSNYGGCDLSKNDCTIIVKVNWKENKPVSMIDIRNKKYYQYYKNITIKYSGNKKIMQNFAIDNYGKDNEILYISSNVRANISSSSTNTTYHDQIKEGLIFKIPKSNQANQSVVNLKNVGHGQAFDYDTKNKIFIMNDYGDEITWGSQTYGSNTGMMCITFDKVKKCSYNYGNKEFTPAVDVKNNLIAVIYRDKSNKNKYTEVKVYNYDYNKLISGKFSFSNPLYKFDLKRKSPSDIYQGMALYNGYIYEVTGKHGGSAYLEVFNLKGESQYCVDITNGYGYSKSSREPEGIKIYDNKIFIGSTKDYYTAEVGYFK